MRYYLGFVMFGLLMGSLCVLLELHPAQPAPAMLGLFGANAPDGGASVGAAPGGADGRPLPA